MKNPWMRKNPFLSMWLSGANAVAGSLRGHAAAEAHRQMQAAINQGAKAATDFWIQTLTPPQPKKSRRRKK